MHDLPPDLPRLRTIETYLTVALAHVRAAIAKAEDREAEVRARRPLPEPPAWVASYLHGQSVPDSIHVGGCRMASGHTKPVTAEEARRVLADGRVSACGICRADSELGILD